MPRSGWPILCAAFVLGLCGNARAQSSGEDVATAQALFDDGKRLMQEGHYDEGCPKLVESQRLDPGGGTLLAIGLCHEAQGKPATAWGDFNIALSEARKDHRVDRENAAMEHIRALEREMPRARILVDPTADGLEIHRDGALVGAAQWGSALPIDPGMHHFDARAPGRKGWSSDVTVEKGAKTVDVAIPVLPREAVAARPPPVVPPAASPPPTPPPPPPAEGKPLRTWGFVTGAAAVALLGVGTGFGIAASSKWNSAKNDCPANRCVNPKDAQLGLDAGQTADVSTVFFTVGGVALAASVVLFVLSPNDHRPAAGIRVTPLVGAVNGLSVGGTL